MFASYFPCGDGEPHDCPPEGCAGQEIAGVDYPRCPFHLYRQDPYLQAAMLIRNQWHANPASYDLRAVAAWVPSLVGQINAAAKDAE